MCTLTVYPFNIQNQTFLYIFNTLTFVHMASKLLIKVTEFCSKFIMILIVVLVAMVEYCVSCYVCSCIIDRYCDGKSSR